MALKGVDLHNRLATSLFSLAFEREASGYTPNESTFSLPLNRYFNLQYLSTRWKYQQIHTHPIRELVLLFSSFC